MTSRTPEQLQLDALAAEHVAVKARLPADEQADFAALAAHVRRRLFEAPLPDDLVGEATRIVGAAIEALTRHEASVLAVYALDEIAVSATGQMQETQMSFNLQYLALQSQMQHENRSYTAISNIMKTKHDTVKNSIDNIR